MNDWVVLEKAGHWIEESWGRGAEGNMEIYVNSPVISDVMWLCHAIAVVMCVWCLDVDRVACGAWLAKPLFCHGSLGKLSTVNQWQHVACAAQRRP